VVVRPYRGGVRRRSRGHRAHDDRVGLPGRHAGAGTRGCAGHATRTPRPAPAPAPIGGPDFTHIAGQAVKGVANISSLQVVRTSNSPFANDPFFRYFFGDDDSFGA